MTITIIGNLSIAAVIWLAIYLNHRSDKRARQRAAAVRDGRATR